MRKINNQNFRYKKPKNNIESLKRSIDYGLSSTMIALQNAAASMDNQKKNIVVADDVYRISKIKKINKIN